MSQGFSTQMQHMRGQSPIIRVQSLTPKAQNTERAHRPSIGTTTQRRVRSGCYYRATRRRERTPVSECKKVEVRQVDLVQAVRE